MVEVYFVMPKQYDNKPGIKLWRSISYTCVCEKVLIGGRGSWSQSVVNSLPRFAASNGCVEGGYDVTTLTPSK